MKKLLLFILLSTVVLIGCKKEEYNVNPIVKEPQYITFKTTGLNSDVQKQIFIICGNHLLDTVVTGNFIHKFKVEQRNVYCSMQVTANVLINDALIIEGQGQLIRKSASCDWYNYEIEYLFDFENY